MIAIFTCQPSPMVVKKYAARPPITMPPGNHTWNRFSLAVFWFG